MMWFVLIIAGLCELGFVVFLEKSDSFKDKKSALFSVLFLAASLFLLSKASTVIPMGVAYAVWTGIGASSSVITGMLFFGESKNPKKIFFLAMIISGVIGLKLFGS